MNKESNRVRDNHLILYDYFLKKGEEERAKRHLHHFKMLGGTVDKPKKKEPAGALK